MRTFDYSPFYRATVGFDRVFDLLDSVASQSGATGANGYPPYNIEKSGDNAYKIVMAVAGYAYDFFGSYSGAILAGAALCLVSFVITLLMPEPREWLVRHQPRP